MGHMVGRNASRPGGAREVAEPEIWITERAKTSLLDWVRTSQVVSAEYCIRAR